MQICPLILVDLIKICAVKTLWEKTAAIRKKSADSNDTKCQPEVKLTTQLQTIYPSLLSFHFFLTGDPHPLFLAGVAVIDALPGRKAVTAAPVRVRGMVS
jgi:hypothetical protein